MSATNATTYYELPVFIATDKPAWLTDWNGSMNAIDTAIKDALTAGENAQATANTATTNIATINDSITTINTSLTTLTSTVTGLVGSVNTINSLIGNGEPTTTDKTLIGAINEIYTDISDAGVLTGKPIVFTISEDLTISFNSSICSELYSNFSEFKLVRSANGAYGKIFGGSEVSIAEGVDIGNKNLLFTLSSTGSYIPAPTNAKEICIGRSNIRYSMSVGGDVQTACVKTWLKFTTAGEVEVYVKFGESLTTSSTASVIMFISLPPCIYMLGDLID